MFMLPCDVGCARCRLGCRMHGGGGPRTRIADRGADRRFRLRGRRRGIPRDAGASTGHACGARRDAGRGAFFVML